MLSKNYLPKIGSLAVAVATLMAAGSAMAVDLYGGGATFPAPAYLGPDYSVLAPPARLSTNAGNTAPTPPWTTSILTVGSVFEHYSSLSGNRISYCQGGSGFGKSTFNGTGLATQDCRDFSSTPLGFAGANAQPDFFGTDAPISGSDYTAFMTGSNYPGRAGITQVPTLAGAIALPHNSSVNGVALVNLTTEQVCKIYSAQYTDWSSVLNGATPVGSGAIRIVHRSDNSGTTFAFTTYLAAKCNGLFGVPAGFFSPNQAFASAITGGTGIYAAVTAASGNNNVVAQTVLLNNALGYADFGEVDVQNADYATVNGFDPDLFGHNALGAATPVNVTLANLVRGNVLNGAVQAAIPAPPAGKPAPTAAAKNCLLLINPATTISGRYPIAAFTYLDTYHSGNGANVTALKDLYLTFYKTTTRAALPRGFAYLDGVATFGTKMRDILNATGGEPGCVF